MATTTTPSPTASASAGPPGTLKHAADFFGKEDAAGVDKFMTVAFRALHEQRLEEELRAAKLETERLQAENGALTRELRALQTSFDANVGDRERVLAFKAKRIEELNLRLKESEAINASLLATLSGSADGVESAGSRASMVALLSSGKPLFHALEACKEHEFRRLFDEKRAQCEQLAQQLDADAALVREMRVFQGEKLRLEAQIDQLQARTATVVAQKDEEVHFLERKLVFEHDRLRREKDADVRACQDEMERHMRQQLDVTTQRTIEENERVQLELRYQSAQLEKLVKQLDRLAVEKKREQHEKRIFEDMNASLSKRVKFYEQLFAKMQEKDQLRSTHARARAVLPSDADADADPPASVRFHSPRKPPLPSLDAPHELPLSSNQSAFSPSPPRLRHPSSWRDGDDDEWGRSLVDGGDQLNSAADALEAHLQQRAFARKQVDAMLCFHLTRHERQQQQQQQRAPRTASVERQRGVVMGPVPLVKKRIVLSKAVYSPSSYQRGRKLADNPTTLDAFIRQHATIPPRQRPPPGASKPPQIDTDAADGASAPVATVLPGLVPRAPAPDRSEMWRARRSPSPPESPATARF